MIRFETCTPRRTLSNVCAHAQLCLYPHSLFLSFRILIFPSISSCPWRPEYISSSTHFFLVGGLHGASCFMWPFSPSVPGVSGVWSLWITPSVCLCSGKKVRQRKGTKRIKGDESTDISWRLLLLSKWRIVLFVLIHLITPPPLHISLQPHVSVPPHPPPPLFCTHMLPPSLCSSHPIFTSHHQIPVCFIPINNGGVFDWVKINNSQPIKGGLTGTPPAAVSQWERSFGGSNEIRSELMLWSHWKKK